MNKTQRALQTHDHNVQTLARAIKEAGGEVDFISSNQVQDFLHILAQNNIELTANYIGEGKVQDG